VRWLICDEMMIYYVDRFRDSFWPDGKLNAVAVPRSSDAKKKTRTDAQLKLFAYIPGKMPNYVFFSPNAHL
jgi:sorting nexin-25